MFDVYRQQIDCLNMETVFSEVKAASQQQQLRNMQATLNQYSIKLFLVLRFWLFIYSFIYLKFIQLPYENK